MFSGCCLPSDSKETKLEGLDLCETNMDDSTDFCNVSVGVFLPVIQRDFVTRMHEPYP